MSSGKGKLFGGASALRVRTRGFSLVEMLIASFIAIIIFTVGFIIISGTVQAKNDSSARIRATENARLCFQLLERDLAAAYPVIYPSDPQKSIGDKESMVPYPPMNVTVGQNVSTGQNIQVESDTIEFYTRIDGRGITDEYALVRYFINKNQQLCRELRHSNNPDVAPADWIPLSDAVQSSEFAMFDRVRSMKVTFHKWDDLDKDYVPPLSKPAGLPANDSRGIQVPVSAASHIRVQLFLFDTLGTIQVDDGSGQTKIVDQDVEKSADNLTIRVMQKVLPIPSGFTN